MKFDPVFPEGAKMESVGSLELAGFALTAVGISLLILSALNLTNGSGRPTEVTFKWGVMSFILGIGLFVASSATSCDTASPLPHIETVRALIEGKEVPYHEWYEASDYVRTHYGEYARVLHVEVDVILKAIRLEGAVIRMPATMPATAPTTAPALEK